MKRGTVTGERREQWLSELEVIGTHILECERALKDRETQLEAEIATVAA